MFSGASKGREKGVSEAFWARLADRDPLNISPWPSDSGGAAFRPKGRPRAAKGRPWAAKGKPWAAKGRPWAAKGKLRAAKGEPKGGQGEAKGRPRGAKGRPREAKGRPREGQGEANGETERNSSGNHRGQRIRSPESFIYSVFEAISTTI